MSGITYSVTVTRDEATAAILRLKAAITLPKLQDAVGTRLKRLTQDHLRSLPNNAQGWPSSGFWEGAARGTGWEPASEGIIVTVDNREHPGAMRFRFNGGVDGDITINMKDKLLTIPARAEFYGFRATGFTNLKFVMFKSGAKALVIGTGGAGKVNFETGNESDVKGAGARSAGVVAFWLVESVTQKANPRIVPSGEQYVAEAKRAVMDLIARQGRG
jgi:hypothetical protein